MEQHTKGDKLIDALNWRFATKEFSEKPVPEEEIAYLMEAARLAPGSYNIQPWRVVVVQDQKLLHELLPVSYNQSQVRTTKCLFVFCANVDLDDAIDKTVATMRKQGMNEEQIGPYEEAVRSLAAAKSADEQCRFAQRQMYIALGCMLCAAALHRIDAGPMEGLDPDGVARVLKLPPNLRPTANVAIGYRKEEPARKKIRNPASVMFERR
jgi:nitroreductase